jgi:hypothetical protein
VVVEVARVRAADRPPEFGEREGVAGVPERLEDGETKLVPDEGERLQGLEVRRLLLGSRVLRLLRRFMTPVPARAHGPGCGSTVEKARRNRLL